MLKELCKFKIRLKNKWKQFDKNLCQLTRHYIKKEKINMCTKAFFAHLLLRKIKTIMREYFTIIWMATIPNAKNMRWETVETSGNSHPLPMEMQKWCSPLRRLTAHYKRKHVVWCKPASASSAIHLLELQDYIHTEICSWMLIIVLFVVFKNLEAIQMFFSR